MRQRQTYRVRGREGERGGERVCNVTQTPASCSGRLVIHIYALICDWFVCVHMCICESACVHVCMCAFMLYALNFGNMYL